MVMLTHDSSVSNGCRVISKADNKGAEIWRLIERLPFNTVIKLINNILSPSHAISLNISPDVFVLIFTFHHQERHRVNLI